MRKTNPTENISRLIWWIRLDFFLAILLLMLFSMRNNAGISFNVSSSRLFLITILTALVFSLSFIQRKISSRHLEARLSSIFESIPFQYAPILFIITTTWLLFIASDQSRMFNLVPIWICIWLISVQFLLIFSRHKPALETESPATFTEKILAICTLFCIFLFLAIPSRLPGVFDGIQWNSPVEFVFVCVFLPASLLIDWRVYSKKLLLVGSLLLVIIRMVIIFSIPESGLEIRSYEGMEYMYTETWQKTYASLLTPNQSGIMKTPYEKMLEFPVEWLTTQHLARVPRPWIGVSINGYGTLQPGEKLIFRTQGLQQGAILLTNTANQQITDALVSNETIITKQQILAIQPGPVNFSITGNLVFKNDKDYQFIPLIIKNDNSVVSAFETPALWTSDSIFHVSSVQIIILSWVTWLGNTILAGLVLACLTIGFIKATRRTEIKPIEFFLGASAVSLLLLIAKLTESFTWLLSKSSMNEILPISAILLILSNTIILIIIGRSELIKEKTSAKGYFLITGSVVLTLFLILLSGNLKSFTIFSTLGDAYEYQYFARGIFLRGDFLLLESPPRAYKILFPYLVGILHFLFGQSASAQLFLNSWCSLLTTILIFKLLKNLKVISPIPEIASSLFLVLIFGNYYFFYFNFGLIEPLGVFFLVCLFYFAHKKSTVGILLTGILTILLRMDYAGAVLAGLILWSNPIYGSFQKALIQILVWLKTSWGRLIIQSIIIVLPTLVIFAVYSLLISHYILRDGDTLQTSMASLQEGFSRVILGGNSSEIKILFSGKPVFTVITIFVLISGTLLSAIAIFGRFGVFQSLDIRFGLILFGFLSIYFFVLPTGYPPRFSTPLLPISIITLASFANQIYKTNHPAPQGES